MTVAIVVCSRDRPQRLRGCLTALLDQGADELLLVDSASETDATKRVADEVGVASLRVDRPGLARARNAGVRATTAALIAFTDDDCIADPGWVEALRTAGSDEQVGFVVGRVTTHGGGRPVSVQLDERPRPLQPGDDPSHVGHGANLAVRRECWTALGGFDELLGVGSALRAAEDTDLMWRALRAGWQGRYEPAAVVSHDQWRGRVGALRTSYGYGVGVGAVHAKARRLSPEPIDPPLAAASLAALGRQATRDARHRYLFGVAVDACRGLGVVTGRRRAARLPLVDGHLQPR